jgi:protein-S-isoprenylcysteine O-methyltransferase Ste14
MNTYLSSFLNKQPIREFQNKSDKQKLSKAKQEAKGIFGVCVARLFFGRHSTFSTVLVEMWWCKRFAICILALQLIGCSALFEDQVGKFDW